MIGELWYYMVLFRQVKERTRGEQGEEKKLSRMLVDMDDMFGAIGKTLGDDVLTPTSPGMTATFFSHPPLGDVNII